MDAKNYKNCLKNDYCANSSNKASTIYPTKNQFCYTKSSARHLSANETNKTNKNE